MTQRLLTLPIRIGFEAARTTVGITTRVLGTVIDLARSARDGSQPAPPSSAPSSPAPPTPSSQRPPAPEPPSRRPEPPQRVNGKPAPPTPPAAVDVTPPSELPDTPLTPAEDAVKTIDDGEELVATVAEPGAEDGPGPQLQVEPPWDGYDGMNASTVVARVNQADAAALALVELYERTHKNRQTVLNAAAKRLKAISPPAQA